jgi:hypothetical protein
MKVRISGTGTAFCWRFHQQRDVPNLGVTATTIEKYSTPALRNLKAHKIGSRSVEALTDTRRAYQRQRDTKEQTFDDH